MSSRKRVSTLLRSIMKRPTHKRRRTHDEAILDVTIDLTDNCTAVNNELGSSTSRNEDIDTARPSTSTTPEVIDLCCETDDLPLETDSSLRINQSQLIFSESCDIDDDLPPPPEIPALDKPKEKVGCPICFCHFDEKTTVMTTKCGHVFCKECITQTVKAKKMCPICRRKATQNQLIVVYLHSL